MKFFVPSWNKTTGYFIRNIQQDQYVPGQVHLLCRLYQKPAQHSIILRTEKRFLEDDGNKAPELEKEHCFLSSSQSQENKKQPSHKGTTSPRQFKCSLTKRNCVGICSKRVKQINICYLLQRVAACRGRRVSFSLRVEGWRHKMRSQLIARESQKRCALWAFLDNQFPGWNCSICGLALFLCLHIRVLNCWKMHCLELWSQGTSLTCQLLWLVGL